MFETIETNHSGFGIYYLKLESLVVQLKSQV